MIYKLTKLILNTPRFVRRIVLIFIDFIIISAALFLTLILKYDSDYEKIFLIFSSLLPLSNIISLSIYIISYQYKALTQFFGAAELFHISVRNLIAILFIYIINIILSTNIKLGLSWFLYWYLITSISIIVRFLFRKYIVGTLSQKHDKKKRVVIYGAGSAGALLLESISQLYTYKVLAFIDDNPNLYRRSINGINIYSFEYLKRNRNSIDEVLIAIPTLNSYRRKEILNKIKLLNIKLLQVPSLKDITSGKYSIDTLRSISIEDLLSRDVVIPNEDLIEKEIKNKSICITGAGGSIGSELCRQILKLKPSKLVAIEMNENSIYKLIEDLKSNGIYSEIFIPILGDVKDSKLVKNIFIQNNIQKVFHAAAYKHLPIVESNPISGIANNVISTKVLCKLSHELSIENFILISTDKAVRPSNVMGTSKRISEMIVQSYAELSSKKSDSNKTRFSMVRFGNVLGSSGSVVPLFKSQIDKGGPITLTHKDVIRYFMTVKEAVNLVLQSSSFSLGGEVFLLDMGDPVKIYDLARNMIKLSGLKERNSENPNGDIEIIEVGLRKGEKLYEELLIDSEAEETKHPLIYKAKEPILKSDIILDKVSELENYIYNYDYSNIFKVVSFLVPEWKK